MTDISAIGPKELRHIDSICLVNTDVGLGVVKCFDVTKTPSIPQLLHTP